MQDMQKQYKEAQLAIQLAGVVVMENVMSCCRSCAIAEMPVTEETDLAWTFAGQGHEVVWEHGKPMNREEEWEEEVDDDETETRGGELTPAEDVYWYHSGGLKAPEVAAKAFADAGFEVVWNGSANTAVLVKFPA